MKRNFIKTLGGFLLVITMVLIYTAAVTQTGKRKHLNKTSTATVNKPNESDTSDIGEPTNEDPWAELDNLVKAYYVKTGVLYQGEMKLFEGNSDKDKLLEEKKFEYTYFNNEYSYTLLPLEVVNKQNYTVMVNHEEKVIAVAQKISGKTKNGELLDLADFKKLVQQQNANIKLTQRGDERILTIDSIQDPNIQGYRIYYSPKTYRISKILVGMIRVTSLDDNSDPELKGKEIKSQDQTTEDENDLNTYVYFLEINYSVVKSLALKSGEFNPENKFVKIEGNKIELTSAFKDYELVKSNQP